MICGTALTTSTIILGGLQSMPQTAEHLLYDFVDVTYMDLREVIIFELQLQQ